jgi:hypothetical protein
LVGLGCCSLYFRYLSRSLLEQYELLCNGQNFPLVEKLAFTNTPSFRSMSYKEHMFFRDGCWSSLGCYSLKFHYLSRSLLELQKLPCNGQNFPLIRQVTYTFTPSLGSMYQEEQINLRKGCWSWLGCYILRFYCFDCLSRSVLELYKLLCNGHTFPLIGKFAYPFTLSLGSMYQEEHINLPAWFGPWLGCCTL